MPENDSAYVPIPCEAHDKLLHLATLREECELAYPDGPRDLIRVRGVIEDVYSQSGAEYLKLVDGTVLRLDQVAEINGEPIGPADG